MFGVLSTDNLSEMCDIHFLFRTKKKRSLLLYPGSCADVRGNAGIFSIKYDLQVYV